MYFINIKLWLLIIFTAVLYIANGKLCTSNGKFVSNHNCTQYVVCNNVLEYTLPCPPGFIFNYHDMVCSNSTDYSCEPSYNCTKTGNFTNPSIEDDISYITCVQGIGEMIVAFSRTCPDGYAYDISEEQCKEKQYVTKCTTNGLFINSYNCDNFTICNNSVQRNISCPPGYIVDSDHMICSNNTSYRCEPNYRCTTTGNFTKSGNEDSYISCIQGTGDIIIAFSSKCPEKYVFNSVKNKCVSNFRNETTPKPNSACYTHSNFWLHCLLIFLFPIISVS